MKLLSFQINDEARLGLLVKDKIIDAKVAYSQYLGGSLPSDMLTFLEEGNTAITKARQIESVASTSWDKLCSSSGIVFDVEDVKMLAPIPRTRKNIICLGLNYSEHAEETRASLPQYPIFFTKPPTSITGPNSPIIFPKNTNKVDFEAELAFIIGKRGKEVGEEDAYDYIAGYTILNDVTARDLQGRHRQWFKGKGLDTFAPMGPYLVTKDEVPDPHNLEISLELNGMMMQKSNTRHMIFKIPTLVKYLTMDMTVEPGDVIATGTPSGVGYTRKPPLYLKPGDSVKISVEKVGVLQNKVV